MNAKTIIITCSVAGVIYFLINKQNNKNIRNSKQQLKSKIPQHKFNMNYHKPNRPMTIPSYFR